MPLQFTQQEQEKYFMGKCIKDMSKMIRRKHVNFLVHTNQGVSTHPWCNNNKVRHLHCEFALQVVVQITLCISDAAFT